MEGILDAALSLEKYRRAKVVWHQWGALLFEGGYYDSAIQAFGRALKLDPRFLPSLLGSGTAYLSKGKARRAARRLLRAVRTAPGEPLEWFHLMQALLRIPPKDPPSIDTPTKDVLTAFSLLRFEALYAEELPGTLSRWKAAHSDALTEARRLTTREFFEGVIALAPPIEPAVAKAREGGITFREAQQFEELRADFVSRIDGQIRPRMGRYFAGLLYDPDRFRFVRRLRESVSRLPWRNDRERIRRITRDAKKGGSGAIVITLEEELGSGRPSRIFVLDQMFETPSIASEEDLISALVNHERVHVNQVGEGIRLRNGRRIDARNFSDYHEVDLKLPGRPPIKTYLVAQEVLAYAEELRRFLAGRAGVTPLYIRSAVSNFRLFYGLLERIAASGVSPDDRFAKELAEEVRDVVEALRAPLSSDR
ncbi:MAG: tetratricopeptide repeat protein [Nitrospinota bacterium]